MGAGLLSQDEINALLGAGGGIDEPPTAPPPVSGGSSAGNSNVDLQYIKRVCKHFSDAAVNVLSTIIGQDIRCELGNVECKNWDSIKSAISGTKVILSTKFLSGFSGDFKVFVDKTLGGVLADLMTGSDGSAVPDTLTELHESAINEGVNQMIASGLTGVAGELKGVNLSTDVPEVKIADVSGSYQDDLFNGKDCVCAEFKFSVLAYLNLPIFFVFPVSTVENINSKFSGATVKAKTPAATAPVQMTESAMTMSAAPEISAEQRASNLATSQKNIMLLMDIPILLNVNLGQTKLLIRDILKLGVGSIIELDKVASEPVDFAAGVKPIARGEVVVVDENFGLRITELVSPYERIEILKKEK